MLRNSSTILLVVILILSNTTFAQSNETNPALLKNSRNVLKINERGELECYADLSIESAQKKSAENLNYTVIRSLNDPDLVRDGLKILLRATDQLMKNEEALLAFRRAAARWERHIKSDITVLVDVDHGRESFGQPWSPGVLGQTSSPIQVPQKNGGAAYKVNDLVGSLKNIHAGDGQLQALFNAIPVPTPTTAGEPFDVLIGHRMSLQAVGILEAHTNPDDYQFASGEIDQISFNDNFNWDYNPHDGISGGQIDFEGTVLHELGHALGYINIAFFGIGGPPNNYFMPWDLFRVRPEEVEAGSLTGFSTAERVATPGPEDSVPWPGNTGYLLGTHTFFDGNNEYECSTGLFDGSQGDGMQAAHWRDDDLRPPSLGEDRYIGLMDPNTGPGIRDSLKYPDLRMLEVTGYKIDYNPVFSEIAVLLDGVEVNPYDNLDSLRMGNLDPNSTFDTTFTITNRSLDKDLIYEIETESVLLMPEDLSYNISFDKISGTISSGQSDNITLTVSDIPIEGIFYGTMRIYSNDEESLVIEIPLEFFVGDVIPATLSLSTNDLGELRIDNKNQDPLLTTNLTIRNKGTLALEYEAIAGLSARSVTPPGLLKSTGQKYGALSTFFDEEKLARVETFYENDFESDFGGFEPSGTFPGDWNITTAGKATMPGHSASRAVYYGSLDSMVYKDYSDAWLIGPPMDFSNVSPEGLVVFSFNHYLDAEVGWDFASIQISLDDGDTYQLIASSASLLRGSDEWKSVMIEFPALAGNPEPVRFAFRFESDEVIHEEGWYIDDVSVSIVEDANTVYTSPRAGVLENQDDSEEITLYVNTANLSPGWYEGSLTLNTNDFLKQTTDVPFLVSKVFIDAVEFNKMYASTGRGSGSLGRILEINLEDASATELGESGFKPVSSLTLNWNSKELYGINNVTGQPSVGIRVSAANGGGLYHFESAIKLQAIAFDIENNLMYGAGSDKKLYIVDPVTGGLGEVGDLGLSINSLAFSPFDGKLYASVRETSEKDRVYTIDKSTADTVRVGRTGLSMRVEALAFDSEGNLYGAQGTEQQISKLIRIDTGTGAAEEIGSIGYRGVLGLAYGHDITSSTDDKENNLNSIPKFFDISQNYPNPFNPVTAINFSLPVTSRVKVKVYNSIGQIISTLVNNTLGAGFHQTLWDGSGFASGIYFYNIEAVSVDGSKNFNTTKKMLLLK